MIAFQRTLPVGPLMLALACGGAGGASGPSVVHVPDGYKAVAELSEGGRLVCNGVLDCGSVDRTGAWRKGPGCRGEPRVRPPGLGCDGVMHYVLPDGSAKSLPKQYYAPNQDRGMSGRLMVQDKSIAVMASDAEYEFGYVLLDERLEVIAEFGRTIRRAFAFKDGACFVGLEDGGTGRVLPDGTLVVDE